MNAESRDDGHELARIRQALSLRRATDGLELDASEKTTEEAIREFQRQSNLPITGRADRRTRLRLGIYNELGNDNPRHALLTLRGTGGVVGQDYTSLVAQNVSNIWEEVPIDYPAAMGGIPVGAANDPNAPSGNDGVEVALNLAESWFEANPHRTFGLAGYSLGAIAATKIRGELRPGGRFGNYAENFVCGVTFGNPCRAFGHTYYLGAIPGGQGISDWHLPQDMAVDRWEWCDLVHPDDLYANVPMDQTGVICTDAYEIVMNTTISDPLLTMQRIVPHLLETLQDAGVRLPLDIPAIVTGAFAGALLSLMPGLTLLMGDPRAAAAAKAAILGLKFAAANTAPHVSYHAWEVWPGQTYLGLGIQHARDWGSRTAVRT